MGFFLGIIIIVYVIPRLIAHIKRHVWNYQRRVILYDKNQNILSITKLTLLGNGQKFHFREDGSLWKRENIKRWKSLKYSYELYYPSGKSKFQSFSKLNIS